jgi:hypothetical protein
MSGTMNAHRPVATRENTITRDPDAVTIRDAVVTVLVTAGILLALPWLIAALAVLVGAA